MSQRQGRYTVILPSQPVITGYAAVVGKKEGEGPLADEFDKIFEDTTMGKDSWEKAESAMHREAIIRAVSSAGISFGDVDMIFAGDLLNQCIGTSFGIRDMGIPFAGLYGACSTMALSMAMAGMLTDNGVTRTAIASTSSHFCSAEKQFRMPLEYGGQCPPSAQRTATAAGAAVIRDSGAGVKISAAIIGRIQDLGITDSSNMGAAMAPAACSTIIDFLRDTGTAPDDYDMILTGDLGAVGSELLLEMMEKQENTDISRVHADCGLMLYDLDRQDVNSGASGCGCSACVVCSHILRRINSGELNKVLFVGTGALLSAVSTLQGSSIPAVAHGVLLTR
ncbi:MAG: stage V sporulation protein AD [Clostridiales bacterium]|nr:stage V sporulation protein AD [Clostridiales bacterium]